jgi:hypothetical protein
MINQVKMFDFILKIFFLKQNCVILLPINNICVNIQLNMHFYIFFQINIYSYESLADEI